MDNVTNKLFLKLCFYRLLVTYLKKITGKQHNYFHTKLWRNDTNLSYLAMIPVKCVTFFTSMENIEIRKLQIEAAVNQFSFLGNKDGGQKR